MKFEPGLDGREGTDFYTLSPCQGSAITAVARRQ